MVMFMSPRRQFRLATEPPMAQACRSAFGWVTNTLVTFVAIASRPALPLPQPLSIGYGYFWWAPAAHGGAAA